MQPSEIRCGPQAGGIARLLAALPLLVLPFSALASPDDADIVVSGSRGAVRITSAGAELAPRTGAVVALAATVETGADGSIDLRQGETTIGIGPGTRLEFPAPESADAIDRVAQPTGNAYYAVGPRGHRNLRVETPYLVAVIKGTQFNVTVTPDSSTISLHEGRLEILAPEGGVAPVTLNAGEVAVRRKNEAEIRVLKVGGGTAAAGTGGGGSATPRDPDGGGPGFGGEIPVAGDEPGEVFGAGDVSPSIPTEVGVTVDAGVDAGAEADIELGVADVGADVTVAADLGSGTVDAAVGAGLDTGVAGAEAVLDTSVDLGAGTIDAGVGAAADLGATGAEISADAGADLAGGSVDVGVDADVAGADASVDLGIDLTGGDAGVDLGADILGTEVELGLGGADDSAADTPAATDPPPGAGIVGDIVGGILGRPRT